MIAAHTGAGSDEIINQLMTSLFGICVLQVMRVPQSQTQRFDENQVQCSHSLCNCNYTSIVPAQICVLGIAIRGHKPFR
jgi:hypothetical protein